MFFYLTANYGKNERLKDLYHVAVLRSKWILANRPNTGGPGESLGVAINEVGEALEAMQK